MILTTRILNDWETIMIAPHNATRIIIILCARQSAHGTSPEIFSKYSAYKKSPLQKAIFNTVKIVSGAKGLHTSSIWRNREACCFLGSYFIIDEKIVTTNCLGKLNNIEIGN